MNCHQIGAYKLECITICKPSLVMSNRASVRRFHQQRQSHLESWAPCHHASINHTQGRDSDARHTCKCSCLRERGKATASSQKRHDQDAAYQMGPSPCKQRSGTVSPQAALTTLQQYKGVWACPPSSSSLDHLETEDTIVVLNVFLLYASFYFVSSFTSSYSLKKKSQKLLIQSCLLENSKVQLLIGKHVARTEQSQ